MLLDYSVMCSKLIVLYVMPEMGALEKHHSCCRRSGPLVLLLLKL